MTRCRKDDYTGYPYDSTVGALSVSGWSVSMAFEKEGSLVPLAWMSEHQTPIVRAKGLRRSEKLDQETVQIEREK